jgi:hypothetical protein
VLVSLIKILCFATRYPRLISGRIYVLAIIYVKHHYLNFKKSCFFCFCVVVFSFLGFKEWLLRFRALVICRGALSLLKPQVFQHIFYSNRMILVTLLYIGCTCVPMWQLCATCCKKPVQSLKFNLLLYSHVQWYQKNIVLAVLSFCLKCAAWLICFDLTFYSDLFLPRHICLMAVQVLVQVSTQPDRTLLLLLLMHLLMPGLVRYNESYISR